MRLTSRPILTNESKLYVQLQPDREAVQWLCAVRGGLNVAMSPVPIEQLHMTIIHFGKIQNLVDSIRGYSDISNSELLEHTSHLVTAWGTRLESIRNVTIAMTPTSTSLFGVNANTYVVEFDTPESVMQLHHDCLLDLESYLRIIGIKNPTLFMQKDFNFQHALSLRPHVTIAKRYNSPTPSPLLTPPETILFHSMQIIY